MLIQLRRGFSDPNFEKGGDSEFDKFVAGIVRDVAELPDRTSPADQPEMMLVTQDELSEIIRRALCEAAKA